MNDLKATIAGPAKRLQAPLSVRNPTLSIIVPAYNVAPYVSAAVLSALDQTFADLEVVVVDDGSTDATPEILRTIEIQRQDPRLRIIRQPNGGLSAARNTAIAAARGDFIGLLDADDLWAPEKAERHLAVMQQDPGIGITFSDSLYLTEEGRPTGMVLTSGRRRPSLHDMIRRNHVGNGSAPIVRRRCFQDVGDFRTDLKSCEDYEMWCRVLRAGYRAVHLNEPLTYYRLRGTSLSFNFEKFLQNADRAMDYLRANMPHVPPRVFRAGHAEHYRIAAWKAVSSGQTRVGLRLLTKALRLRPSLIVTDWRAIGTAVALLTPAGSRQRLVRLAKSFQKGGRSAANQDEDASGDLMAAVPKPLRALDAAP